MSIVQRLLDTAQMRTQYPEWLCAEMEAAAEEIMRLRKDAGRYRWLRDRMAVEDMPEEHPAWSTPSEHESAAFDSAVDARMNGAND